MIDDRILLEAAEMAGELKKMLLALALVALFALTVMILQWACDRFGATRVGRWLAPAALALGAIAGAVLRAFDLI